MQPQQFAVDDLTGLLNRKAFFQAYRDALEQAQISNEPLSLAFFDIDHFDRVNREHGHVAGDAVIAGIARMTAESLNERAILARYGGDEFFVILPGMEREEAFLALEKVRGLVATRSTYAIGEGQFPVNVTVSVGVASYPVDGRGAYELMRKADQALYRAKANARNSIRLAVEEKMVPKTAHYTQTQLERLSKLAQDLEMGEAELLREAMDDLLMKYTVNEILSF
jgi:diguanylate cyclase (GGDEF)-like protein